VSDDDFPTTSTIKRRVDQFKTNFARDVVTLYTELTETVQLNTLSIAVKRDQSDHTLKRVGCVSTGSASVCTFTLMSFLVVALYTLLKRYGRCSVTCIGGYTRGRALRASASQQRTKCNDWR